MDRDLAIERLTYLKLKIKNAERFKGRTEILRELEHYISFLRNHAEDLGQNTVIVGLGERLIAQAWAIVDSKKKAHECQTN
jgi:hypothetical protein